IMPHPEAVAGTYVAPEGRNIQVPGLSDDERMTFVRWIDLGCPIDLTGEPTYPGWVLADQRPTLTLTFPWAGDNGTNSRILVGMHDYGTGLDMTTFHVSADFEVNGVTAGKDLAGRFRDKGAGVWELVLDRPITALESGNLTLSVMDRQGNLSRVERRFKVK